MLQRRPVYLRNVLARVSFEPKTACTCAIAPEPIGISSNSSNTSSNGRWKTRSITRLVWSIVCGLPRECSDPRRLHSIDGNRSARDAAHCASWIQCQLHVRRYSSLGTTNLDKRRACTLHLRREEAVPPHRAPSVSSQPSLRWSNQEHRRRQKHRNEYTTQVDEPLRCENRLQYPLSYEREDSC